MFQNIVKIFFFSALISFQSLTADNIGLLIMATGKYISFVEPLIQSAEQYFCEGHHVTYFVFTDGDIEDTENIVKIYQPKLGWPFDTMMRFEVYYKSKDILLKQDYLYACDADMLFTGVVGDEILGERVGTQHPGFVGKRGSYETNPLSLACVYDWEGTQYFAGGFYGGTSKEVMNICKTNSENISIDLSNGIIAVWHDESHWNRYSIDNPPTVILTPAYCYPESWDIPYPKKLLALDKNHKDMREPNK